MKVGVSVEVGALSVSVSSVSLSPTNDYDDDGLCVWACSGHGDCYIDDGEKLPSCHCEVRIFLFSLVVFEVRSTKTNTKYRMGGQV